MNLFDKSLSLEWKTQNEEGKVWRQSEREYNPWGLDWELIASPTTGTASCKDFFLSWAKVNSLMVYIIKMAGVLQKILDAKCSIFLLNKERPDSEQNKFGPLEEFTNQRQNISEILLCRQIDNFQTYISSILFESYLCKPDLLKSNEKIDVNIVLGQKSLNDIVMSIAERKVESLMYSSFMSIRKYIEDKFNTTIVDCEDLDNVITAIETRNIIIHNKCIVNNRYITKTHSAQGLLGKKVILDIGNIERLSMMLAYSVKIFDNKIKQKLNLENCQFIINPYD